MANRLALILPKKDDDDNDVGKEVDDIVEAMEANTTTFPDPDGIVADVKAANTTFKNSIPSARNSSIALEEDKMKNKMAMLVLLAMLGRYVVMVSNGDRSIAAISGFKLNKASNEKKTRASPLSVQIPLALRKARSVFH